MRKPVAKPPQGFPFIIDPHPRVRISCDGKLGYVQTPGVRLWIQSPEHARQIGEALIVVAAEWERRKTEIAGRS